MHEPRNLLEAETLVRGAPGARSAGAESAASRAHALLDGARRHRLVIAVLVAFVASAFLIPTLAPVGFVDDPIYARSVEILLHQHRLEILPVTAETLLFQVGWGALFGAVFGYSLGILHVATLTLVGFSGIALYGLCLQLGIGPGRSALGAAIYLFNPLGYVLGFTFMSDSYLVALMVIALYLDARAFRGDTIDGRWIVAGSVAASLAFLVRQQGALIPVAVASFLLVTHRVTRDRAGARLLAQVLAVPAFTIAAYYVWLHAVYNGPPNYVQSDFTKGLLNAGPTAIASSTLQLGFITFMYVGLFVIPLVVSVLPRARTMARSVSRIGWVIVGAAAAGVVFGIAYLANGSGRDVMPYVAQFVNQFGIGPPDLHGGRVPIAGHSAFALLTAISAASALVVVLVFVSRRDSGRRVAVTPSADAPTASAGATATASSTTVVAGLVTAFLVWQALAIVPTSLYKRNNGVSFDRYLLPVLPLVLCLMLWALKDVRIAMRLGWLVTVAVAVFSVAGTHDYLMFERAAWSVASDVHARGVSYRRIDAGGPWGAYHLFEYGYKRKIVAKLPVGFHGPLLLSPHDMAPWWIGWYAPATQGDYVVSSEPLYSYTVLRRVPYSSWLSRSSTAMYLLRHRGVSGPP